MPPSAAPVSLCGSRGAPALPQPASPAGRGLLRSSLQARAQKPKAFLTAALIPQTLHLSLSSTPLLPFSSSPLTTHGLRLTCTTTHGASVTRPQSDRRPARSSSHDSSQRGGCARLTRPRPGWRLTRRPPQGRGRARAHARQRTHAGEALPPPPPAPAPELSATTRTRSETAPARR